VIFLIHYRHRGAPRAVQGIGRALPDLPGRRVVQLAARHAATPAARPAGSVVTRRNTQGRTR